jgi:hypothetical protein
MKNRRPGHDRTHNQMGNMTERHNGWRNYETWSVHRWLNSDKGLCVNWKERGRQAFDEADDSREVWDDGALTQDIARERLAKRLRARLGDTELLDRQDVYSELLGAALEKVDWEEIADSFLPHYRPSFPPDDDVLLKRARAGVKRPGSTPGGAQNGGNGTLSDVQTEPDRSATTVLLPEADDASSVKEDIGEGPAAVSEKEPAKNADADAEPTEAEPPADNK